MKLHTLLRVLGYFGTGLVHVIALALVYEKYHWRGVIALEGLIMFNSGVYFAGSILRQAQDKQSEFSRLVTLALKESAAIREAKHGHGNNPIS